MNDRDIHLALVALTDFCDDLLDSVLDSLDDDDKLELIADLDKLRAAVDRLRDPAVDSPEIDFELDEQA